MEQERKGKKEIRNYKLTIKLICKLGEVGKRKKGIGKGRDHLGKES